MAGRARAARTALTAAERPANDRLKPMDIAATLGQPVVRAKDARAGGRLLGDYARDFSVWTPATSTLWRVWGRVTNTLRNGRQDGLSWVLWLSRCLEGRGVKHGFR